MQGMSRGFMVGAALLVALLATASVAAAKPRIGRQPQLSTAQPQLSWTQPAQIAPAGSCGWTVVRCPSSGQCTAAGQQGPTAAQVTFDPRTLSQISFSTVGTYVFSFPVGLSCPSTALCVALAGSTPGSAPAFTFDPQAPSSPTAWSSGGYVGRYIACPERRQCSMIAQSAPGFGETLTTVDPTRPPSDDTPVYTFPPSDYLTGLACPSERQCTTLTSTGEITFNPRHPSDQRSGSLPGGSAGWLVVRCPSVHQCTALAADGTEVTFDPRNAAGASAMNTGLGSGASDLACPTRHSCTAISATEAVTFDPHAATIPPPVTIDSPNPNSSEQLDSIDCPSESECVAVDFQGRVLIGTRPGH